MVGTATTADSEIGVCVGKATALGRFIILRQIGCGGMGTVFAAYDPQLDRKVALKLLHSQGSEDSTQHERTLREAKALARVTHPRVVSIYEVGEAEDQLYLAMEFVDGITLRAWQSEHRHSWQTVLWMYLQAGEGLKAAHESGVVHRDFKPDNVLVGGDGLPRVADFGVAHLGRQHLAELKQPGSPTQGAEKALFTFQGAFSGTVGYMSPEQYEGETVTAASDQFSFCAALYEALYGYLPFEGLTAAEQSRSTRGPVRSPPVATQVPEEVFRILSRGMSQQPAGRYPSMAALLSALSIEHQQTAAAAAITRRRLQLAAILLCIPMTPLIQYLSAKRARIHREAVGVSLFFIVSFLAAGYVYRKALQRNAFHRRMWTHLLITFFQNFCFRILVTSRGGVAFSVLFAVEMIIWFGATLSMATLTARSMRWLPGIPLGAATLALFYENPPRQVFLFFYPLIYFSVLWCWRKESLT